ncbi:MAG: glutamate-cysteine ligase family protein [Methanothrix sp.]|nr:glutamate-cysteine ligase family protein [Methanothrix sp.]
MPLSSVVGTEHECSINDELFRPLPISDRILESINGEVEHEVEFGGIRVSKELQKHVIELIPARPGSLAALEADLHRGLTELLRATDHKYRLLGLGMHPLLELDQTCFWDHDEQEYYRAYDRLFDIRQHGWLNIQALQINIPYCSAEDLVSIFNKVRSLMPYLVAVSAASPMVEGRLTPYMDNRLVYYRDNQRSIPEICNGTLPERLGSVDDYVRTNRRIYSELKRRDAEILCREWVNSRGVIVRFTRRCLEVKAIDEQECLRSDMAMAAFLLALLRADLDTEQEDAVLRSLLERAMRHGVAAFRPELERLYSAALKGSTYEERRYLPLIARRIEQGSLAEIMVQRLEETGTIRTVLEEMEWSLRENRSVSAEPSGCG